MPINLIRLENCISSNAFDLAWLASKNFMQGRKEEAMILQIEMVLMGLEQVVFHVVCSIIEIFCYCLLPGWVSNSSLQILIKTDLVCLCCKQSLSKHSWLGLHDMLLQSVVLQIMLKYYNQVGGANNEESWIHQHLESHGLLSPLLSHKLLYNPWLHVPTKQIMN